MALSNNTFFINPVDTCTVTAVHFLAPYPALAVADNRGGITLWAIYPSLHKYRQPLTKWSNVSSGDRDAFVRKASDMVNFAVPLCRISLLFALKTDTTLCLPSKVNFAVVCMRFNSEDCSLYVVVLLLYASFSLSVCPQTDTSTSAAVTLGMTRDGWSGGTSR